MHKLRRPSMIIHAENSAGLSLVFLPACPAENVPSTANFGTPRHSTEATPEDAPQHRWRRFAHIAVFATRTLGKIALDLPSSELPFSLCRMPSEANTPHGVTAPPPLPNLYVLACQRPQGPLQLGHEKGCGLCAAGASLFVRDCAGGSRGHLCALATAWELYSDRYVRKRL